MTLQGKYEKYVLNQPEYYNSTDIFFDARGSNVHRSTVLEIEI